MKGKKALEAKRKPNEYKPIQPKSNKPLIVTGISSSNLKKQPSIESTKNKIVLKKCNPIVDAITKKNNELSNLRQTAEVIIVQENNAQKSNRKATWYKQNDEFTFEPREKSWFEVLDSIHPETFEDSKLVTNPDPDILIGIIIHFDLLHYSKLFYSCSVCLSTSNSIS
jgi:hypothetical protein